MLRPLHRQPLIDDPCRQAPTFALNNSQVKMRGIIFLIIFQLPSFCHQPTPELTVSARAAHVDSTRPHQDMLP